MLELGVDGNGDGWLSFQSSFGCYSEASFFLCTVWSEGQPHDRGAACTLNYGVCFLQKSKFLYLLLRFFVLFFVEIEIFVFAPSFFCVIKWESLDICMFILPVPFFFQVVEFGKPSVLLAHPNSMFAAMVAAANAATGGSTNPQLSAPVKDVANGGVSADGAVSDGAEGKEDATDEK